MELPQAGCGNDGNQRARRFSGQGYGPGYGPTVPRGDLIGKIQAEESCSNQRCLKRMPAIHQGFDVCFWYKDLPQAGQPYV